MILMAVKVLADIIPNPTPSATGLPGASALSQVFGWVAYAALAVCGVTAVMSGAKLAYGNHSGRPDMAVAGKMGLVWSLAGAAIVALGVPLTLAFYHLVAQ